MRALPLAHARFFHDRQACSRAPYTGFGEQQKHSIYIWDRHLHHLIKILEGPKDALVDLTVGQVGIIPPLHIP